MRNRWFFSLSLNRLAVWKMRWRLSAWLMMRSRPMEPFSQSLVPVRRLFSFLVLFFSFFLFFFLILTRALSILSSRYCWEDGRICHVRAGQCCSVFVTARSGCEPFLFFFFSFFALVRFVSVTTSWSERSFVLRGTLPPFRSTRKPVRISPSFPLIVKREK